MSQPVLFDGKRKMSKITAIRAGTGHRKRVNIHVDGKFALSLEAEAAAEARLKTGQELNKSQIETLARTDNYHRCRNAALQYLSYRPRSESEMRERLERRGFGGDSIEAVITRLKEQELLDDAAFARFWKDNRQSFSPRSQWLIKLELSRKGINNDILNEVISEADDDESAYQAAAGKVRSLSSSDHENFRRQVGSYLKRRGFNYQVINHTVERLWQERGSSS